MMMAMRAPPSSVLSAWASMCSRNTPRWHVKTRIARTIPAARMKMNREHRVPLSRPAVEVLDAARTLDDGNRLVFPNRWGNPVKGTFLSELLRNLDIPAVPHGCRSGFRDWAAEETDHPREVIESSRRRTRGPTCSSGGGG